MGTTTADLPGRRLGPPGTYIRSADPPAGPAPALTSSVPAFIGFTDAEPRGPDRRDQPAVVLTRWDPPLFFRSVAPAAGSFLPMAVQGFFANGGERCVIITVPRHYGVKGLLTVLEPDGSLEDRSDIDLLCIPDAGMSESDRGGDHYQVQIAALRHCERMQNRFAILDTSPTSDARDLPLIEKAQGAIAQL
ncbi:MAG: hypothetical protein JOZ17_21285, partial [Acetobacteraceae bacterium]|nr:hypothetical protein [Acetobacteraceae bacterium]MBV8614644.1 hypothetical protein [Acetobacteraceae bacterium]